MKLQIINKLINILVHIFVEQNKLTSENREKL